MATTTSQAWPGPETWYSYDPSGRRVMKDVNADPWGENGGPGYTGGAWEYTFYSITGQKLMTTVCTYWPDGSLSCGAGSNYLYFGSRLIQVNGALVVTDRLGSVRAKSTGSGFTQMSYFPWGEERTVTPDGTEKFGTYFRDGPGQDYAQQRYYNQADRFCSPEPAGLEAADWSRPVSWNRYTYLFGDPENDNLPNGSLIEQTGPEAPINTLSPLASASVISSPPDPVTSSIPSQTTQGDGELALPELLTGLSTISETVRQLLQASGVNQPAADSVAVILDTSSPAESQTLDARRAVPTDSSRRDDVIDPGKVMGTPPWCKPLMKNPQAIIIGAIGGIFFGPVIPFVQFACWLYNPWYRY